MATRARDVSDVLYGADGYGRWYATVVLAGDGYTAEQMKAERKRLYQVAYRLIMGQMRQRERPGDKLRLRLEVTGTQAAGHDRTRSITFRERDWENTE